MSRKVGNSSSSSSPKIASSVKESAVTSPSVPHGGHQSMFRRDETRGNADRPVRGPGKLVPRKGPVKGNGEENLYVDQRNGDQSNGSIHAVNRRDGSDSGNLKSKNGTTKPDEAILRSDLVTSSPSERRERLATRSEPLGTEPVTQEVVRRPPQAVIQENGNEQAYKVDKEDTTPTTSAPQRRRQLLATTSAPVRLPKVELQPSLYGIIADANGDASEDSSPQSSKSDVLSQSDHTGGATCGSERSLVRTKSLPSRSFADDDGEYRRSNTQSGGRRNTHKGKENLNVRLVAHEKMSERRKKKLMREIATIQQDGTVEFDVAGSARIASNLFGPGIFDEGGEVGEEEINEEEDDILRDVPPLQIVMLIVGTRGDVQPFVAIGKHLQEYGHRVRLATHVNFRDFVMTAGLEFYPLGGDPKVLAGYMVKNKGFLPSGPGEIQVQRKQIKAIINSLLPACVAADTESGNNVPFKAQAIIANPPAYGHVHVAEYLQVPLHIFFTMPWTATSQFPHPLSRVKQPAGYRMSYQVVDSLIWWGIRSMINDFRKKKLKLRPINYFSGSQGSIAELPTGYIWSPHLVPKPRDWGPLVDVVGFCFLNLAQDYKPPKDLLQWLKAGPAPIYIGFGSLPVVDPKGMTEIIVRALEATHQRGIIFKGWGGMGDLKKVPENIFLIEDCPHDWLFKQCAAVVHHGGAGTTAAGLKAACPTTVVPFFGDQPFWGEQIHAKGVGPSPIAVDQFSFDKLVKAIEFMMKDEVKQRATEIALAMENEDGIEGAVMAFHKHLPHDTPFPVHTDVPDKSKFKMFRPLKNVYSCFS